MSRPPVRKTSAYTLLLVLGTIVTCHVHASDRAVIEVREESAAEVLWFRSAAVLFTNRNDRVAECPEGLAGERFLRSWIDSTEFEVVQAGRLTLLTTQPIPGATTQVEPLETQGFVRTSEHLVQLFGSNAIVGKFDPTNPERLLIHADVSFDGARTNMHQWWVTTNCRMRSPHCPSLNAIRVSIN